MKSTSLFSRLLPVLLVLVLSGLCSMIFAFQVDLQRGLARGEVTDGTIEIDYGRPPYNGRDLLSMLAVGRVWRLGMNNATTLKTDVALQAGGTRIEPGTYVLSARRAEENAWELQFHDSSNAVLAQAPMAVSTDGEPVDLLTIDLEPLKSGSQPSGVTLRVSWGTLRGQSEISLAP